MTSTTCEETHVGNEMCKVVAKEIVRRQYYSKNGGRGQSYVHHPSILSDTLEHGDSRNYDLLDFDSI